MKDLGWVNIANLIITFLLGGGFLAWLQYYRNIKKEDRSFSETELELNKTQNKELNTKLDKIQVMLIPSFVPEWRKTVDGKYEYINRAYEVDILLNMGLCISDIIGKTDAEVFVDYPDFIRIMKELEAEAKLSLYKFSIKRNVLFPKYHEAMIIKEVVQNIEGKIYLVGKAYTEHK